MTSEQVLGPRVSNQHDVSTCPSSFSSYRSFSNSDAAWWTAKAAEKTPDGIVVLTQNDRCQHVVERVALASMAVLLMLRAERPTETSKPAHSSHLLPRVSTDMEKNNAEYFLGSRARQDTIRQELAPYRQSPGRFVEKQHPQISFVTLNALAHDPLYALLVCQLLLRAAREVLAFRFFRLADCSLFDPERVWIGVAASAEMSFFGGFYHADQGYRYLQQIAIASLSGVLSYHLVDHILRTLELLRAYAHDTLHHQSYRLFCPMPAPTSGPLGFYRLQYGVNFRRWNGQSYSARDSVRSPPTRKLGTILAAATDRFAQAWVCFLAESVGYQPREGTFEEDIYPRDVQREVAQQGQGWRAPFGRARSDPERDTRTCVEQARRADVEDRASRCASRGKSVVYFFHAKPD